MKPTELIAFLGGFTITGANLNDVPIAAFGETHDEKDADGEPTLGFVYFDANGDEQHLSVTPADLGAATWTGSKLTVGKNVLEFFASQPVLLPVS